MMRALRITQLVAVAAAVVISAMALVHRGGIGVKGMPVSADNIVLCVVASAVAAYMAARSWHWLPAPCIAGIVGVLAGGRLGPVGALLGFFIGLAVTVVVIAESRLAGRSR